MKPFIAPFSVCACLLSGVITFGQSAPTMNDEPHHKRLTYIRNMRVFEITVPPGDMTQNHLHDHDMVTVALEESTTRTQRQGEDWTMPATRMLGAAQSAIATGMPYVHRLENVGKTPYRVFAMLSRDARSAPTLSPRSARFFASAVSLDAFIAASRTFAMMSTASFSEFCPTLEVVSITPEGVPTAHFLTDLECDSAHPRPILEMLENSGVGEPEIRRLGERPRGRLE
jgi:hypothetical protein